MKPRKPKKRQIQKQKMEKMLAQRKTRKVNTCRLCSVRVIGPALRALENRLGRFMPCGCEQLCWSCAYKFAVRESLYCADGTPILNQDDLDQKQVRCPCCNMVASAFQECGPAGTIVEQAALPFRDLSWDQRNTLRRELPSACGRQRGLPQFEQAPDEKGKSKRPKSEEEGKGTVPPMPPGAFVKEEDMPAAAVVKEGSVVPPMPPDAFVKAEAAVKEEEEERSASRPKRRRSK